jgi:adenylate cyclase
MAQEIERKFLVTGSFGDRIQKSTRIVQGYLSSVPERSVRVRVMGDAGFIAVKGIGNASGTSRFEWEQGLPAADAEQLLALCEPGVIEKVRHLVPAGAHTFEVDEFHGANEGLVIAEVELSSEDEAFLRPEWLGQEVTGDVRFYNVMLAKHPYTQW